MADDTTAAAGETPEAGGRSSVLDSVRARREQAQARKHLTVPIPGWGGGLCVRYRVIDPEASQRAARALRQVKDGPGEEFAAALSILCEILAVACMEAFARDDDGELIPLRVALGGELEAVPVRFDQRLCEAVGITPEKETPGAVVRTVFCDDEGHLNVVALMTHAEKVSEWMEDTSRPVEDEILGESSPGSP